jgi:hypothetical protein
MAGLANALHLLTHHLLVAHQSTCCHFVPDLHMHFVASVYVEPGFACCEFDFHVDTCALGRSFLVPLVYTGCVCDVPPYYEKQYEAEQNVPIFPSVTANTCQERGQTFIFVINEGLSLGSNFLTHF